MNRLRFVLAVSALSGFVALSYEIIWYRVVSFVSWGLAASFGLLLGAYLYGLAKGAQSAGKWCTDEARGQPAALQRLSWFVLAAVVVALLVVPFISLCAIYAHWFFGLTVVAIAAGMLGAVLPLACHFGIAPDERAGERLSWVYLANIVGSSLGSFVTGFVWMDRYPLVTIAKILAVIGFGLFALIAYAGYSGTGRRASVVGGALVLSVASMFVLSAVYDGVYERLAMKRDYAGQRFLEVVETKSGVITTTRDGVIYGGGAYDGKFNVDIRTDKNGILRAYSLGAMHPNPKRVLVIGLSSGSWAQVLVHLPGVETVDAVEINPGYMRVIAAHAEVKSLLGNPKFHSIIDDGRRYLSRHPDAKYDAVVMNTTWHWRGHSTNLLSTEFMQLVRAHLLPGGMFLFNTTSSDDAQRTAAETFPHALRVYNFMAVSDSPFSFDTARWERTLRGMTIDGTRVFPEGDKAATEDLEALLAYPKTLLAPPTDHGLESRESILARTKDARIITDDNMVPEWRRVFLDPPRL